MKTNQKQKNIPNGWKNIELDYFVDLSKKKFDPKKEAESLPCIEMENLEKETGSLIGLSDLSEKTSVKNYFDNKNVLFGKLRPYLRKFYFPEFEGVCSTEIWVLKNNEKSNPAFIYSLVQTERFIYFANKTTGSRMPRADWKLMKSTAFNLPPLPEQNRIVAVLETWDSGIEKLKQKIAIKKEVRKGLMQELLTGKTRLPGFSGEWEVVSLGNLGSCLRGVSYKPKTDLVEDDKPHTYRLLRSNNVKNGLININDIQIVIGERVKKTQVMSDGDILICMANGSKKLVGKSAVYKSFDSYDYTFGAFMGLFRFNENADKELASYLFKTSRYKFYISNLLSGSSINNLKPSDIESMEFHFPKGIKGQKAIAEILTTADEEITTLEQKLTLWQEQKKYLLNNLVTGQIRTPENLLELIAQ